LHSNHIETEDKSINNLEKKVDLEKTGSIDNNSPTVVKSDDAQRLKNLGIQIAVALALHNFPEGLSTFAAAIANAKIGVIYAVALSLHKIPE
ncbi:8080_t:CDS:2, partial [Racocetra fulgida]